MRLRRDPADAVGDAERARERVEAVELGRAVGAARSADDDEGRRTRAARRGSAARGRAPFSGWIRPTNSSTARSSGRCRRRRASTRVTRSEDAWSTPGGMTSTRSGSAPYPSTSSARSSTVDATSWSLHATTSSLDGDPLGRVVVDPDERLAEAERVERGDQREVELVLQPVTDHAGDPVVRVDAVEPRVLDEVARRGVDELVDQAGEVALVDGRPADRRRGGPPGPPARGRRSARWRGSSQRVRTSHSTPARASAPASDRTYTFMPPPSPAPGCASGDVCTLSMAMRRTDMGSKILLSRQISLSARLNAGRRCRLPAGSER